MDHQPLQTPIQPGAPRRTVGRRIRAATIAVAAVAVAVLAAACSGDRATDEIVSTEGAPTAGSETESTTAVTTPAPAEGESDPSGTTVTLLTHDSFALSPETLEAFTAETGIEVEQLASGDAGALVAQACLTAGEPLGDVLFGIDNTFLQRGLDCGMFEPYTSPGLADVPDHFELDPEHRVTPVDFGDVCLNYWIDAFDGSPPPPASLDDLTDPAYAGMLVVQSPETSSPGLAFLLATIAHYGDGWEEYWAALRDNGVAVTAGWEDAYWGEFIAGGGERPIVVSYASSPPAEVIFADPPVDEPPTGVVTASCYRQIEFAGVLAGAGNPGGAQALIDFMLTPTFQNDVPLNMFVFPVATTATLPDVFVAHAEIADDPFMVDPAEVEAQRNAWTDRWVEIVLR
ncbi:MAG: thiamine ABC transporter substrate-binding protein [Acidimicrobiaceae bacterium]|nr:thiamine ABC transporter substrate-binding protein [Acidimicrobiaceae bacterium]